MLLEVKFCVYDLSIMCLWICIIYGEYGCICAVMDQFWFLIWAVIDKFWFKIWAIMVINGCILLWNGVVYVIKWVVFYYGPEMCGLSWSNKNVLWAGPTKMWRGLQQKVWAGLYSINKWVKIWKMNNGLGRKNQPR